jgi:hypothetical protein
MDPIALPSDMVMVETRAGATPDAPTDSPEEQHVARRPRPLPVQQQTSEEPLVQVETRNE